MINKKILICDDDQGILDMMELILEDAGFETISEINSLNVYKLIEAEQPDLLLLDLWMPVLSGDQILRLLKHNTKTTDIPVIVISASIEGKSIAEEAGANDFLAKPFDINELISKVQGLLN
ncbi:MAG: response regulator transcription factor [Sphingobacteriaceae bacterium]|nr:MAG: response regulator transcription factor [Sphingobacteriaceae bacterium]